MQACYRFTTVREKLNEPGPTIHLPKDVSSWITRNAYTKSQSFRESAIAIFLDCTNRIIGYEVISIGTTEQSLIDKKMICRTAIELLAHSVIMVHNHPSGNEMPSVRDIQEVSGLKTTLSCLDIKLLDALILGENKVYSFTEEKSFDYQQ